MNKLSSIVRSILRWLLNIETYPPAIRFIGKDRPIYEIQTQLLISPMCKSASKDGDVICVSLIEFYVRYFDGPLLVQVIAKEKDVIDKMQRIDIDKLINLKLIPYMDCNYVARHWRDIKHRKSTPSMLVIDI